jgi:FkbM family methyltransferase
MRGNGERILRLLGIATLRGIAKELCGATRVTADFHSFIRLAMDICLSRLLKLGGFGIRDRERTIKLRNGAVITYRLNRGDIQGIREVWFDEVYRLPCKDPGGQIIDLGANIGLTSVYFAKTYKTDFIVAVEPNQANVKLARRNFEQNSIVARVIEAAIGPIDGVAHFSDATESNMGHVSDQGREIRMLSMPTLLNSEGIGSIDLLKMDIECGEQALLSEGTEWLDRVQVIIAEFHPTCVDYPGLRDTLIRRGFTWIKPGSIYPKTTDTFIRPARVR